MNTNQRMLLTVSTIFTILLFIIMATQHAAIISLQQEVEQLEMLVEHQDIRIKDNWQLSIDHLDDYYRYADSNKEGNRISFNNIMARIDVLEQIDNHRYDIRLIVHDKLWNQIFDNMIRIEQLEN